ncbi:MAG: hypothetical protein JSU86_04405 [Phycisphaerales bacterium]|nr:MAG: hypothetical protein JSU86_04405 [Phycisphaerales bacterium]
MIRSRVLAFALAFVVAVVVDFLAGFVVSKVASTLIGTAAFAGLYVFLRWERRSTVV